MKDPVRNDRLRTIRALTDAELIQAQREALSALEGAKAIYGEIADELHVRTMEEMRARSR